MLTRLAARFGNIGPLWLLVILAGVSLNLAFLLPILAATWLPADPAIVAPGGFTRGGDFITLWPALDLVLHGRVDAAYSAAGMQEAQARLTGIASMADRRSLYPPTYLLLTLPLALLPYLPALALWQALQLGGFLLVMARFGLPRPAFWLIPLSAGVVQAIATGQNGLLSALLLGGGLILLARRPAAAGLLFALVTVKPTMALLIGPALLAAGQWRALAAMAAAFAVLALASLAAFGAEPWITFFQNLVYAREVLGSGHMAWPRMPTVFVAARMSGIGEALASTLQSLIALGAAAAVVWAWWRRAPFALRAALLVAAIPLTTPWFHDYDAVILLLPLAFLIRDAARAPLARWEIAVLVLAWILPAWWMPQLVAAGGLAFGPLITLALFALILGRAIRARRPAAEPRGVDAEPVSPAPPPSHPSPP